MALLQPLYNGDELYGGEIEDGFGLGMIPQGGIFPLDHKDVLDPQHCRIKQIRLQGQSISIPTSDLKDGFDSFLLEEMTGSQGPEPHHCVLKVRDDDEIHPTLQEIRIFQQFPRIDALRGLNLRGDDEFARFQLLSQAHPNLPSA
jgi:hypothetical protein